MVTVWKHRPIRLGMLLLTGLAVAGLSEATRADIVHNDDVIITFSLGVGSDSTNGQNFGFDTIILRENNLRILFDDTSSSGSFPNNDWRLTANDSANGGGNYFSIDDATTNRQVFRVDAGAPANSLRVDSAGDVGVGIDNPVVELHVRDGDSPTLRLEQDGSSGFAAQSWDIAGNETNFFVRDVSNGSRLPFRIKPSAPTNSLYVDTDGAIGLGTASPEQALHVRRTDAALTTILVENANAATQQVGIQMMNSAADWRINNTGNQLRLRNETANQEVLVLQQNRVRLFSVNSNGHPLEVDPDMAGFGIGAHVTDGGVWTNGSSRTFKQNIELLAPEEALAALRELAPVMYQYIAEPDEGYVG